MSVVAVRTIPSEYGLLHCCVILSVAVILNVTESLERNVGSVRDCM